MKKLLLTLGAVASVAAPVAAVVACSSDDSTTKLLDNATDKGIVVHALTLEDITATNTVPSATMDLYIPNAKVGSLVDWSLQTPNGLLENKYVITKLDATGQPVVTWKVFLAGKESTPKYDVNPAVSLASKDGFVLTDSSGSYYYADLASVTAELKIKTDGHFAKANNLSDEDVTKLIAEFKK